MLTTYSLRLVILFIGCLIFGLLLGNLIILVSGLIPLILLLVGLLIEQPKIISIQTKEIKSAIWLRDVMEISHEVTVIKGLGIISIFQELPKEFTLAGGNNFRIFWKGWHKQTFRFSYSVQCNKRGIYILPSIKWESRHFLNLTQIQKGTLGEPMELAVQVKALNIGRMWDMTGVATTPFPDVDVARIGIPTTDFRDIRRYVPGDATKSINWKATANKSRHGAIQLLVNEYEVESKKTVWIFLDASSKMEVGTDVENVFEYGVEAVEGIIYYYLHNNYRVGMYVYNSSVLDRNKALIYPDTGKRQFIKVARKLTELKPGTRSDEFPEAIQKCQSYILGCNPLCIIVTRLDGIDNEDLLTGINKLRRFGSHQQTILPILVINIPGYNVIPSFAEYDEGTLTLLKLQARPLVEKLRNTGISIIDWNPGKDSFGRALTRQARTK